jgi:hypothetical protein
MTDQWFEIRVEIHDEDGGFPTKESEISTRDLYEEYKRRVRGEPTN